MACSTQWHAAECRGYEFEKDGIIKVTQLLKLIRSLSLQIMGLTEPSLNITIRQFSC